MPGCRVSGAPAPGAGALDDVEDTGRQAGLVGDVGQQRGGERGPLRWLDHDGVAGREGRSDPPGGQHQRRVPGRDDRDHAGRVEGDPLAVAADLAVLVVQLLGPVGEVAEVHAHAGHHAAAVGAQQRAVVAGLDAGEVLGAGVDAVGDAPQDRGPLGHGQRRPGREGRARRAYGEIDLVLAARGDLTQLGLVDGRDVGERRGGRDPLPVDPVPGVDLDTLDLDRAHARPPRPVPGVQPSAVCWASEAPPSHFTPTWR